MCAAGGDCSVTTGRLSVLNVSSHPKTKGRLVHTQSPLSSIIDGLFQQRWPDGTTHDAEVAEFVSNRIGEKVSRIRIYRIRTGRTKSVDGRVMEAIGEFFEKPMSFFSSSESGASGEDITSTLANAKIEIIGMRSNGKFTPELQQEVSRLMAEIAEAVGAGTITAEDKSW